MGKLRYVIGSMDVGGAERHLLYILPKLKDLGWDIKVILLNGRGVLAEPLEAHGIAIDFPECLNGVAQWPGVVRRPFRLFMSLVRLTIEFIKDRKTAVHFFLPESTVLGMLAAIIVALPAPKVMSRRSMNDYQLRRPLLGWVERKLHKKLDMALGNSAAVTKQLQEEGIPPDKVKLIYNGIDEPDAAIPDVRKQLKIGEDTLVMVIVANLIPYKGHVDLLQALASINSELANWCLLCIGNDRGILSDLKQTALQLGVSDNILWLQDINSVAPYWQTADIGILASHEEGFSNAILEAMSVGLPMVVTDVGGNAEAVVDNQSGFVVPAKQPKQLATAISKLASNRQLRHNFGSAARKRYAENYTTDKCVNAYDEFYRNLYRQFK